MLKLANKALKVIRNIATYTAGTKKFKNYSPNSISTDNLKVRNNNQLNDRFPSSLEGEKATKTLNCNRPEKS